MRGVISPFPAPPALTQQRPASGKSGAGAFSCGLSGGTTALIFLGALREAAVDWSHVTLYWADERAVAPDHPDLNYGLAERLLLSPLGGRAPQAIRMPAELPDLKQAAVPYDRALSAARDLLILGVGDDGHICSLFPNHPILNVRDARDRRLAETAASTVNLIPNP